MRKLCEVSFASTRSEKTSLTFSRSERTWAIALLRSIRATARALRESITGYVKEQKTNSRGSKSKPSTARYRNTKQVEIAKRDGVALTLYIHISGGQSYYFSDVTKLRRGYSSFCICTHPRPCDHAGPNLTTSPKMPAQIEGVTLLWELQRPDEYGVDITGARTEEGSTPLLAPPRKD